MSGLTESSSDSDGELERLKAAVSGPQLVSLKTTPAAAPNIGRSPHKDENTTTKHLAVSRETQKFLAKKLSNYLDSFSHLDVVTFSAANVTGPQAKEGLATSGVKLFRNSKRPLDAQLAESSVHHRKEKLPLCSRKLHNESSESEGEEEKLKLSEAAIDPEVIKRKRLA